MKMKIKQKSRRLYREIRSIRLYGDHHVSGVSVGLPLLSVHTLRTCWIPHDQYDIIISKSKGEIIEHYRTSIVASEISFYSIPASALGDTGGELHV